jgi:hypothetical protein
MPGRFLAIRRHTSRLRIGEDEPKQA